MIPLLRVVNLSLCVFMLFTHTAVGHWKACRSGKMNMTVGIGETYLFNSSSPITIPPKTKCKIEIFAQPLTILSMTVSGYGVAKKKVQIFYDDRDVRGVSFIWADPRDSHLVGVGYKYIVLIDIPSVAPPAELTLKLEGEAVERNANPLKMDKLPMDLLPRDTIEKFTTVETSGDDLIGVLVDCYLPVTIGRLDPRALDELKHILFYSDKSFITSADRIYEDNQGIFLTNATVLTMVNTHDDSAVTTIVFPYKASQSKELKGYSFADWRRGKFKIDTDSPAIIIGKGSNYDGSLKKVNWGSANKLEIYEEVGTEGKRSKSTVKGESNHTEMSLPLPNLLYTFQSEGSVEFELNLVSLTQAAGDVAHESKSESALFARVMTVFTFLVSFLAVDL